MAASMEAFESYFKVADLNQDGKISGPEAVAFFQGSNLPQQVLAQVWSYADQNKTGFLGRQEFFNALKLVTVAQSGRALTPEMVKAALFGPAAPQIPAPKINAMPSRPAQMSSAAAPMPQRNALLPSSTSIGASPPPSTLVAASLPPSTSMTASLPPTTSMGSLTPAQYSGFRAPQALPPNMGLNQQLFSSNASQVRPYQPAPSPTSVQVPGVNQGLISGGNIEGPRLPSSGTADLSIDWLGNRSGGISVGGASQAPPKGTAPSQNPSGFGLPPSNTPSMVPGPQAQQIPSFFPPKSQDILLPSVGDAAHGSKALVVAENVFPSATGVRSDVFSADSQPITSAPTPSFSAGTVTGLSTFTSAASGSQNLIRPAQVNSMQTGNNLIQQTQSIIKQDQPDKLQITSALAASNISAGLTNSAPGQPQSQWPKISQSDIVKYTKVFEDVDKDRDGKITGTQARNLFLSWRLPREVLKQVWDLSDQDNDGMLSLREFCIALYLMERHRQGSPLPPLLPDSLRYDEKLLQATSAPLSTYGGPTWQQNPGVPQSIPGAPVVQVPGMRPPVPTYLPSQTDSAMQIGLPKSNMAIPSMDNHMVNQFRRDEQSSLSPKSQEASDTDKKVQGMEKQILDSKEKIEYYRTKMQDLVLYKSRCDNRLNEITERASADKREVESLAKKYEEKYKQVGELASKLAVEEAAFRDVQERKLELHNALIKMEQGGSADGLLQVRADRIQYQLEELEKALSERCKHLGLQVKPATSIELPSGWQPGAQEGAIDWEEDWDKFEDQGFIVAKGDAAEFENVLSAENPKSSTVWNDNASMDELSSVAPSSNGHIKNGKHYSADEQATESESAHEHSEEESARSPDSPGRSSMESPFVSSQFGVKESYSEHDGAEFSIGDKYADETSWKFDDTDSVWGSDALNTTEADDHANTQSSFFGSGDFGLSPIGEDSPSAGGAFGKKKSPFFEESLPSSPAFSSGFSSKFNEDSSFNYGRFDSFKTQDSGFFPQDQSKYSRFDSMSSSKGDGFMRFDSMSSSRNTDHMRRFDSFDDADPFGSTGPFKASGSHSPPRF